MANVYNISKFNLCNGNLDLDATGTDLRLLLLLSSGPPQFNADDATIQAVLAQTYHTECTASGYSRTALTGEVTSNDTGNDRTDCSANKVTFTSVASGQTIGAAVLYKEGTTDALRVPLAYFELTDTATNGGDIEIRFDGVDGVGDYLRLS